MTLVPDATPLMLSAENRSTPYTIPVKWQHIPAPLMNGILRGYRINYQAVEAGDEKVSNFPVKEKITGPNTTAFVLDQLESYTVYHIKVTGFTNVGDGPEAFIYAGRFVILIIIEQ